MIDDDDDDDDDVQLSKDQGNLTRIQWLIMVFIMAFIMAFIMVYHDFPSISQQFQALPMASKIRHRRLPALAA